MCSLDKDEVVPKALVFVKGKAHVALNVSRSFSCRAPPSSRERRAKTYLDFHEREPGDRDQLLTGRVASNELDVAPREPEELRKKTDEFVVRSAVYRRSGQRDLDGIPAFPNDLTPLRTRLGVNLKADDAVFLEELHREFWQHTSSMSGPVSHLSRPLVLSGFMATGKSTIGRLLAERFGVPFFDTDALLAAEAGKTVSELFSTEGEARFREREADLVLRLLGIAGPSVVSFGGGTVTIPRVRHAALEAATLVCLTASAETIVARVSSLAARPNLLSSSPLQRTRDLLALRREAYAECHASVSTEGRSTEEVAGRIAREVGCDALVMPLGSRSYPIDLIDEQPERLHTVLEAVSPSSLLIVTDTNVQAARGAWLERALERVSARRCTVAIAPGEPSKTVTTVSRLWDEALASGIDRDAVVLAFGGGVVGDLAGFAASTLLRGLRCVQIPTSLLAMVDSSVGGKTGFDHAAGKNLIGSFFQPQRVLVDIAHLSTLPIRERAAGLAEVVKIALILDSSLLEALETGADALAAGDRAALRPIVRAAIAAKVRVVRDDERESGDRALLNLGHTVGHALEAHGGYARLLHGEAVAVGTVLELLASERLGLTPSGMAARAEALFERLGLPTRASTDDVVAAWPFVLADKKRASSTMRLPVVVAPGRGKVAHVELAALYEALAPRHVS